MNSPAAAAAAPMEEPYEYEKKNDNDVIVFAGITPDIIRKCRHSPTKI